MITVTDYWAPWCGPCKAMMPAIEKLAEEYNTPDSDVQIKKVNVDEDPEIAASKGIRGIPTLIVEKDGVEIARRTGAQTLAQLTELIETAKS